ncbi:hypothetical protein [Jannaschia sp. 2305UL9-9]|uniref:hypothetical protein n=1 Tax=Jannaschia sp. 2305UL9-9 TaxID=3121638 RepID=UPI003528BE58
MADTFDNIPLTVPFLGASIYLGAAAKVPHGGVASTPAYKLGTILSDLHDALTVADAKAAQVAADPDLNDVARKKRIGALAGELHSSAKAMQTDSDAEATAMDRAEAALYPALPDDAGTAVKAGEMRAYLRGLSDTERRDFLTRQAKAGNLLPLQAAADPGLGMLAGADPEVVAAALRAYAEAHRAEDWARLANGREMHRLLDRALGQVIPLAERMAAPDVENPGYVLSLAMTRKLIGDSRNPADNIRIKVPA